MTRPLSRPMGTNISAVWLAIYRAQQPVPYARIAADLSELSHNQRAPALKAAYQLGYLERTGTRRAYEYSVTPKCTVPPGVMVLEVLEGAA